MESINFLFGIHNHQPTGNFDFVFESAFEDSYRPFIEVLEYFPELSITMHFSGCLLEWLEKHKPDYIDKIGKLVDRGNIELLSGGFYEPVLPMLPDRDKIGQIEMMNEYLEDRFGYSPRGIWLTERVWEPGLAKPIAQAGIKYVTVDDYHFLCAGKQQEELDGAFITEEQGYSLWIFPINQNLRYAIPFEEPETTVEYLRKFASERDDQCIVMADDGEKFGVWPGTHKTVFEEEWLERFFSTLQANQDWINTQTFKEYYEQNSPKDRIYLPTASYFEMSEWTLPAEQGEKFDSYVEDLKEEEEFEEIKPFFRGGTWRNFLNIYDESNWMQKKYLDLSDRLKKIKANNSEVAGTEEFKQAQQHLWRGTCNCAYWHGLFGGLYLPHLRHAIYSELLKAEKIILTKLEQNEEFRFQQKDLDRDGKEEILIDDPQENLHYAIRPKEGGYLEEFSLWDKSYNILNTLNRYKESYHKKVSQAKTESQEGENPHEMVKAKEEGLEKFLRYDDHPRKMFIDHILSKSVNFDQLKLGKYNEAADFIEGEYEVQLNENKRKLVLKRKGWVNWQKFKITKEMHFGKSELNVKYKLVNEGENYNSFQFGPEFNFSMLGGDAPDRYFQIDSGELSNNSMDSAGVLERTNSISVINEFDQFQIKISSNQETKIARFPIETVSLSEGGFERVYQSSVVIPLTQVNLKSGGEKILEYKLEVIRL